jgi:hypothetical protein
MDETLLPRKGTTQPQPQYEMEEVPMKLNDSISTYDVAEALQGETGRFEVTSPNGERYFVTCQPGHSIVSLEWAGSEPNLQPFLVRKVAQLIANGGSFQEISGCLILLGNPKKQPGSDQAGLLIFPPPPLPPN